MTAKEPSTAVRQAASGVHGGRLGGGPRAGRPLTSKHGGFRGGGTLFAGQFAGGDALGHGARAKVGFGGHGQLGIDDDIAGFHAIVGVFEEANLPAAFGRLHFRLAALADFRGDLEPFGERSPVELFQFGIEGAARVRLDTREDAAQPIHILRMEIDVVEGRRQRGIEQRLQTLAHIADDFQDDLASCSGVSGGGMVHKVHPLQFYQPVDESHTVGNTRSEAGRFPQGAGPAGR